MLFKNGTRKKIWIIREVYSARSLHGIIIICNSIVCQGQELSNGRFLGPVYMEVGDPR